MIDPPRNAPDYARMMMDIRTPADHSGVGLLEALVGPGFAAALQDGLSRSVPSRTRYPAGTAERRFADIAPAPVPARRRAPEDPSADALHPREAEAVLRNFGERLPAALGLDPDLDGLPVRSALVAHARQVLADTWWIATTGTLPPAGDGDGPALPAGLTAAAGALLTECVMLHALAAGHAASAMSRATALLGPLGQALRHREAAVSRPAEDDELWRERRRLAREVHDEFGARLSVALHRLDLHAARAQDPDGHLATAGTCVRAALDHARGLVAGLREATTPPPLRDAVDAFVEQAAPAGVRVRFASTGDERLMPEGRRRELFLAVRECLRNAFSHAGACQVTVTSRTTRRWSHVRIQDDGAGFDTATGPAAAPRGHGLRSVTDRVESIGGRVTLSSAPGEGTRIDLHVPLGTRA